MKLKVGDIFTIPIDDNRIGLGQILNIPNKECFIIAIYDTMQEKTLLPEIDNLENYTVLFLGYTTDAKFYHKHWVIVGNSQKNITSIYLPYYKLGTPPKDIFIVNYKGERLRKASISEYIELKHQSIVAPVRYENALKANFNLADWNDKYDELLYTQTLDSIKIADKL